MFNSRLQIILYARPVTRDMLGARKRSPKGRPPHTSPVTECLESDIFKESERFPPGMSPGHVASYLDAVLCGSQGRWGDSADCISRIWDPAGATPFMLLLRATQYCKTGRGAGEVHELIDMMQGAGVPASDVYHIKGAISFEMYNDGNAYEIHNAVRYIKKACESSRNNAELHAMATTILLAKHYADSDEAHVRGVRGSGDTGILGDVIRIGRRAIRLGSTDPILYLNVGNAHLNSGRTKESIRYFEEALRYGPRLAEAKLMIGTAMAKGMLSDEERGGTPYPDSDYKRAIAWIDEAMEMGGPSELALTTKADVQAAIDDADGLRGTLSRLARFRPSSMPDIVWRIQLHALAGDPEGAEPYMRQAAEIDPSMRFLDDVRGMRGA